MKLSKGCLLIASQELDDPNFSHTVALLIQYGADGAMALVLNRPTNLSMNEAWQQVSQNPCTVSGNVYLGGPCEGPLMALHGDPSLGEIHVGPDIYFCGGSDHLEQLMASEPKPVRFFAGYAGWGAGQLEREIAEGSWHLCTASADQVFEAHHAELWMRLLRQTADAELISALRIRHVPSDPRSN